MGYQTHQGDALSLPLILGLADLIPGILPGMVDPSPIHHPQPIHAAPTKEPIMTPTTTSDHTSDHTTENDISDGAAPLTANPAIIGIPMFVVGSIALGLQQVGFVPPTAAGAPLAIITMATGIGTLLASLWAMSLGQSAVAGIFGIFSGFWLSYSALILGLTHGWYAVAAADAAATIELFLLSWLLIIVLLTLGTLRLPLAFTLVFALIDLSLLATLLATLNSSTALSYTGGYLALAFAGVGSYLFMDACIQTTGGKGLPLGAPFVR